MIDFMLNSMFICFQGFVGFWLWAFSFVIIICVIGLISMGWNELKIWWGRRNGF